MKELEERFLRFSLACREYLKSHRWDEIDRVYKVQLARTSSSVGANYIEAKENLGKQDLLMHLKISRKEAKEFQFRLQHLGDNAPPANNQLRQEAEKIRKNLSSIISRLTPNP